MENTKQMMYILSLEIISSIFLITNTHPFALAGLFISNTLLLAYLFYEPYWKTGSSLLFLVFLEVTFFLLNKVTLQFLIKVHCIGNMITLILGMIVLVMAHRMRITERGYEKKIFYKKKKKAKHEKTDKASDDEIKENDDFHEEEQDDEEKTVENETFVLDSTERLHKTGCKDIKGETKVIGSKRYALHKGYTPCKVCKPFS